MNRKQILQAGAAGAALTFAPSALGQGRTRGDGFDTIPYTPLDTRPYVDPMRLTAKDVDAGVWRAVRRINTSGWVWTAESCEGHPGRSWSAVPEIRLVCRTADLPALMALIYRSARVGDWARGTVLEDSVLVRRHASAQKPGWAELRVFAWRTVVGASSDHWRRGAARGGRAYFNRLSQAIVAER